ncbi:MAG TPA: DUF445 domain-containing protein [Acidimicrobiia bacterium]|nr:DUF445 domain-containing protein [Acidimicrobiia bacterium]
MSMTLSPEATLGSDSVRARLLVRTKRQATGVLAAMAVVYVAAVLLGEDEGVLGFVRAGAEASLVGGLADWFAVTALFRHPAGLPIPHTAVIPKRKDQFGRTLGRFVQENLLTATLITDRVRNARIASRVAEWLADDEHAALLAGYILDAARDLAEVVEEDDVERLIEEGLRRAVDRVDPAALAAKGLTSMVAAGYHQEAFNAVLRGAARFVDEHRRDLQARFLAESPWWRPEAIDKRIFNSLVDGALRLLDEIAGDPDHPLRDELDRRLEGLIAKLETSPALQARVVRAKEELLGRHLPQLAAQLWSDARAALAAQSADPRSELRSRLSGAIAGAGRRLRDDPVLLARGDQLVERVATYVAEHFHGEIGALVDTAISRWDGEETARRLELLLGPDLQFIRINGTVIGGLAGIGIHTVGVLLR